MHFTQEEVASLPQVVSVSTTSTAGAQCVDHNNASYFKSVLLSKISIQSYTPVLWSRVCVPVSFLME